jgi:ribosomal protein S15P/S13E
MTKLEKSEELSSLEKKVSRLKSDFSEYDMDEDEKRKAFLNKTARLINEYSKVLSIQEKNRIKQMMKHLDKHQEDQIAVSILEKLQEVSSK